MKLGQDGKATKFSLYLVGTYVDLLRKRLRWIRPEHGQMIRTSTFKYQNASACYYDKQTASQHSRC